MPEILTFTHKKVGGMVFPHSAYAYVPHRDRPAEWKFRIWESPEKKYTKKQVATAIQEYAAARETLPGPAVARVRAKLLMAWRRVNPGAGVPEVLRAEESDEPQTVDIENVELFAIGTWKGRTFTENDLDNLVEASASLPHLSRPVILGHDDEQPILAGSGLPAVGWVENLRRVGGKLIGDLHHVPSKVGALIRLGAFRKRSSEIYMNYTDSVTGKAYPLVFKALALLGAAIPEVKTIDDIYALYDAEASSIEQGELIAFDTQTISEHGSFEYLISRIGDALPEGFWIERTWPSMVLSSGSNVAGGDRKLYLIPWEFDINGDVAIGQPVEVEREVFYTLTTRDGNSAFEEGQREEVYEDGGLEMSDELRKKLVDLFKLSEDASDEDLLGAAQAAAQEPPEEPEESGEDGDDGDEGDEDTGEEDAGEEEPEETQMSSDDAIAKFKASDEYKVLKASAEAGKKAARELFETRRDGILNDAVKAGKILPKDKKKWAERYEKDPKGITEIITELSSTIDFDESGGETDPEETMTIDPTKIASEAKKYQEENPNASLDEAYMMVLQKYGEE